MTKTERQAAVPPARPRRILLAGYIGFGNLGDEAMLAGTITWLRAQAPEAQIQILSVNPAQTAAAHHLPSLRALPAGRGLALKILARPARWQTLARLWRADLVIWIAGSGVFSDAQGPATLAALWPLLRLLRRLARRLIFLSVSAGPLEHPQALDLTRRLDRLADALCPRDRDSADLLRAVTGDSPKIIEMADLALELAPAAPARLDAIWRTEGLEPAAPYLAVCPIYFFQSLHQVPRAREDQEQFIGALAAALDELARAEGLRPLLIPFQQGYDGQIARAIAAAMKTPAKILREGYAPAEMLGLLVRMRCVIGVRYHSLVLAALARTPLVTIVYDAKSRALLRELGLEHLSLDYYAWRKERPPLDGPRLVALVREALRNEEALRLQLGAAVAQLRRRTAAGTARLKQLGLI